MHVYFSQTHNSSPPLGTVQEPRGQDRPPWFQVNATPRPVAPTSLAFLGLDFLFSSRMSSMVSTGDSASACFLGVFFSSSFSSFNPIPYVSIHFG